MQSTLLKRLRAGEIAFSATITFARRLALAAAAAAASLCNSSPSLPNSLLRRGKIPPRLLSVSYDSTVRPFIVDQRILTLDTVLVDPFDRSSDVFTDVNTDFPLFLVIYIRATKRTIPSLV